MAVDSTVVWPALNTVGYSKLSVWITFFCRQRMQRGCHWSKLEEKTKLCRVLEMVTLTGIGWWEGGGEQRSECDYKRSACSLRVAAVIYCCSHLSAGSGRKTPSFLSSKENPEAVRYGSQAVTLCQAACQWASCPESQDAYSSGRLYPWVPFSVLG